MWFPDSSWPSRWRWPSQHHGPPLPHRPTPGCVSGAEYRKIHMGMTRVKVRRIFDTKGKSCSRTQVTCTTRRVSTECVRAFLAATGDTKVQVQYSNYAAQGGPQRMVFKQ